MGAFLKQLIGNALKKGIPMRGAMALGETVIDRRRGIMVGAPLAEAYNSDKHHQHRGVGIHLTDAAVGQLAELVRQNPPPLHMRGIRLPLLLAAEDNAADFMWYRGSLFIDHWARWMRSVSDEADFRKCLDHLDEEFNKRGLPEDDAVRKKREQTKQFFLAARRRDMTIRWARLSSPFDQIDPFGPESVISSVRYLADIGLRDEDDDS